MKTKRVWKLWAVFILLVAVLGAGQAAAFESGEREGASVTIDYIDTREDPDLIVGQYKSEDDSYELTSLDFYAIDGNGNKVSIDVTNIDARGDTYRGEFDYTDLEGYAVIGVDATFQNASGATLTAKFEGLLGPHGQCHEGICVPVYFQ